MPIMVGTLYLDMINFFRNQIGNIFLLTLLTTLISIVLDQTLSPGSEHLMILSDNNILDTPNISLYQMIQRLSEEQKQVLIKISFAGALAGLVGNVLLASWLIIMINQISNNQFINLLNTIILSIPLLPRLMLLISLTTLLVQLGLILIIIPGITLAIAFSLAPIIAVKDNSNTIRSMRLSANLSIANIRLLAPAILLWLLAKAMLFLIASQLTFMSSLVVKVLLNELSNIISSLLIIYLYRLYMLLQQK